MNEKISQLPRPASVGPTDLVPIVQAGGNYAATVSQFPAGAVEVKDAGAGGTNLGAAANADGSILFEDASGDLSQDLAGNFFYDSNGAGPLGLPSTLYVGGANGNTSRGVIALWDSTFSQWYHFQAESGDFHFYQGFKVDGNMVVTGNVSIVGFTLQVLSGGTIDLEGQTSGAGGNLGTLANAPAAGNPAFWLPVTVNGVQYWIPCWA